MALPNQPLSKPKKRRQAKACQPAPIELTDLEIAERELELREILGSVKRRLGR